MYNEVHTVVYNAGSNFCHYKQKTGFKIGAFAILVISSYLMNFKIDIFEPLYDRFQRMNFARVNGKLLIIIVTVCSNIF